MKKKRSNISVWGASSEKEEIGKEKKISPRRILADLSKHLKPFEALGRVSITLPRLRAAGLRASGLARTEEGLELVFGAFGGILFEHTEMRDLIRRGKTLRLEFGGGVLEITIEEKEKVKEIIRPSLDTRAATSTHRPRASMPTMRK